MEVARIALEDVAFDHVTANDKGSGTARLISLPTGTTLNGRSR